jgi:hypothetical protein
MSRRILVLAFLVFALQGLQAQTFSRGIPASVVSPTADGQTHGIPASVVSPAPLPPGVHLPVRPPVIRVHGPMRRFGNPHNRRPPVFVPVPLFYSYYTDGGYPSPADPYVADNSAAAPSDPASTQQAADDRGDEELRAAYLQGAHDALAQKDDSRYGEHFLDSRERQQPAPEAKKTARNPRSEEVAAPPVEDKSPATVFIFKDGHQLETKNYAIMSGTLFDFSGSTLKKIQLQEIDAAATVKANDDRGVQVKLQ